MSAAAVGYEGNEIAEIVISNSGAAQRFWSFLQSQRTWRNTALAVVAVAAMTNVGLLVITARF